MSRRVIRGFLRSDGTPNFSNNVYEKPRELDFIIQKPVHSATANTPIIKAIDLMLTKGIRRIPITTTKNGLIGIVTATDMVNFFGGGENYNIVKLRYGGRFFSALYAPVETIMSREVVSADVKESFSEVLERMIRENVGSVPVVDDGSLVGIITEYDVVKYLSGRTMTGTVEEYMSPNPVMASPEISIKSAARLMVSNGFRRIPLVDGSEVKGIVTTMDIVRFFGEGKAFRKIMIDEMDQVISTPVREIMSRGAVTVDPKAQLGDVAPLIRTSGVGAVLVEDRGAIVGILTERDLLMALAVD
ncbi:MAG: CBS domain-containing protein [Candidatus Verstraetearchaeota archaeon]|nr:CBS domain-containing protein [Candidatus Verstraetearchaeota archaeon]